MDEELTGLRLPPAEEHEQKILLKAILEEALVDLERGQQAGASPAEEAAMQDSLDWISRLGMDEGEFGWLVSALGMQPHKTRGRILDWFAQGCRREAA